MGYTYVLECADGSFYVGSTRHLLPRVEEHNYGEGSNYTRPRLPVVLVYYEEYERIADAFAREKQLQGWGRAKRIALITGATEYLPALSRKVWRRG
ncbi:MULTISPECIES: GIY-YIG nuclease family protein [unclassified Microbacterium]|uniref:GIY-YIG nuclease family protein n=1 Tax=unclassified Microbacterium TaxID=2609290 RepID=UPI00214B9EBA|nr:MULTISPECIES: GIY-YIG nuclease family protein [unclassified Microbacterium]MCR2783066.1 GIY-YIG nuclease family protein [Microbacterium sp. zg.B96]WIM16049.1 GIY-YIG nuclease family protein [Microbacterium sp. zg-B96]